MGVLAPSLFGRVSPLVRHRVGRTVETAKGHDQAQHRRGFKVSVVNGDEHPTRTKKGAPMAAVIGQSHADDARPVVEDSAPVRGPVPSRSSWPVSSSCPTRRPLTPRPLSSSTSTGHTRVKSAISAFLIPPAVVFGLIWFSYLPHLAPAPRCRPSVGHSHACRRHPVRGDRRLRRWGC